jgi:hypothetical protein
MEPKLIVKLKSILTLGLNFDGYINQARVPDAGKRVWTLCSPLPSPPPLGKHSSGSFILKGGGAENIFINSRVSLPFFHLGRIHQFPSPFIIIIRPEGRGRGEKGGHPPPTLNVNTAATPSSLPGPAFIFYTPPWE